MEKGDTKDSRGLNVALSNTYLLMLKTQNYHWNIEGSSFYSMHLLLEKQYQELFEAVDKIAELIRSFGLKAPARLSEYQKLSIVEDGDSSLSASEMIADLSRDHDRLIDAFEEICQQAESTAAIDLLSDRIDAHAKMMWMLSASV